MEFMPHALSKEDSDVINRQNEAHFRRYGFGLCAVELPQNGSFPTGGNDGWHKTGVTPHEQGQHAASHKEWRLI
jgi:hypothetical protein